MSETTLVINRRLNASAKEVFAAWTDPAVMRKWYGPGDIQVADVLCEPVVGGRFRVVMEDPDGTKHITFGTFSEVVPGQKIVHTWQWEGSEWMSQVTVELTRIEDGVTDLRLTHERFPDKETTELHVQGWQACLVKLDSALKSNNES